MTPEERLLIFKALYNLGGVEDYELPSDIRDEIVNPEPDYQPEPEFTKEDLLAKKHPRLYARYEVYNAGYKDFTSFVDGYYNGAHHPWRQSK